MSQLKKSFKFKGKGLGTKSKQPMIGVRLSPNIDAIVRSLPNRSDFLREAIAEKLEREKIEMDEANNSSLNRLQKEQLEKKVEFIIEDLQKSNSPFGCIRSIAAGVCDLEMQGEKYQLQVKLESDPDLMYPYELKSNGQKSQENS